MKIAIATGKDIQGSGYYRGVVPGLALRKRGHDVKFVDGYDDQRLFDADVMLCMRVRNSPDILGPLTAIRTVRGTKIIHDLDDNYHDVNLAMGDASTGKMFTLSIDAMNRAADVVSVTTPELAVEYSRDAKQIAINYNAIDDDRFSQFATNWKFKNFGTKRPGEIRIGWAGSRGRAEDLRSILKPLKQILKEFPNVKICFIGDDLRHIFRDNNCACSYSTLLGWRSCTEHGKQILYLGQTKSTSISASLDYDSEKLPTIGYYKLLNESDIDIGLVPMLRTRFSAGKSYLKLMEYGMCGIPSIAIDHGPYRQYANESPDREVVLLSKNENDWLRHMRHLIADEGARYQLALNNFDYVASRHLVSQKVSTWEETFAWAAGLRAPALSV